MFIDWIKIRQTHRSIDNPAYWSAASDLHLCGNWHDDQSKHLRATRPQVPDFAVASFDPCPIVDGGIVGKFARDDNGQLLDEPEWVTSSRLSSRGSFQSHYMFSSDGSRVVLDGNIGRWNRVDNLFNLDFSDTWEQANRIAEKHGCPYFTAGELVPKHPEHLTDYDKKHGLTYAYTGAVVDELHLTQNYVTGSEANAIAAISWLQTQSKNRIRRNVYDTVCVSWGQKSSRRIYLKAYIKADEMLAHAKAHGRTKEEVLQDPVYQFCKKNGVIRFELELGDTFLKENHLHYLGEIKMQKLTEVFNEKVGEILNRTREDLTRIDLAELDLKAGELMAAQAYLRGEDVRATMIQSGKLRTFQRYAKKLKQYGIDINEPLGDTKQLTQVIKVVSIAPLLEAPAWYWDYQNKMSAQAANDEAATEEAA